MKNLNFILNLKITKKWFFILLVITWIPAVWFLKLYLIFNLFLFAGVAIAIYAAKFGPIPNSNNRYLIVLIPLLVISIVSGVKTFYFLSLVFSVFLFLELYKGKISYLPLFSLFSVSPIAIYIAKMAGFNLRLSLTEWAVKVMHILNFKAYANGNIIVFNNQEFFVDEACTGLKLLEASFLLAILILAFHEKYLSRTYNLFLIAGWLMITLLLNIVCNISRIIILVVFEIMPSSPSHMMVGVVCLFFYVLIPLLVIGSRINSLVRPIESTEKIKQGKLYMLVLVTIGMILAGFKCTYTYYDQLSYVYGGRYFVEGFITSKMGDGISKLSNNKSLVYVKPIANFYNADHNPSICWQGSGYQLKSFNKVKLKDGLVYFGILEKEGSKFYTAWWYQDTSSCCKTIDQFQWRTQACFYGKKFNLVNVNSSTYKQLLNDISLVRAQGALKFI